MRTTTSEQAKRRRGRRALTRLNPSGYVGFSITGSITAVCLVLAAVLALAGCGSTRTVTVPGPSRTVTATATRTVPGPVRTVYRTRTRTITVPETPRPVAALPPGVTPGPEPGTYYVDCFTAQCTSLPGAGPFGTTCGQPSTGEQLCQLGTTQLGLPIGARDPQKRGHEPLNEGAQRVHQIEYTGAALNPWRVTTDDNVSWDAATEIEAVVELAEFIISRDEQARPAVPALPEGAVLI
jgi:hypothetical protein